MGIRWVENGVKMGTRWGDVASNEGVIIFATLFRFFVVIHVYISLIA
jgi:hypothetical protein